MTEQEKELFKQLCSFKGSQFDESLLKAATPTVLGHLFFNRMHTIAYYTLKKHKLLGKINREFRNSLKNAYTQSREKNKDFLWCVEYLGNLLSKCDCSYAMLKGAYLCGAYPEGCRTSNDIDLLVHPSNVSEISHLLLNAGFEQGHIRDGEFSPATRKEIIESKMMRGETVPYIRKVHLPGMEFLEVDINFSLDYKPGETDLIEEMLSNTVVEDLGVCQVRTLNQDDFFIHLCAHLYKEATTLPWIEMMRDMTLYKYCDIYMLLCDASEEKLNQLFRRAKDLGMEKVCAFAVYQMSKLFNFGNVVAISKAKSILDEDEMFIHTVVSPGEKKNYIFAEKNISNRFFANSRESLLEEVSIG